MMCKHLEIEETTNITNEVTTVLYLMPAFTETKASQEKRNVEIWK